MSEREQDTRRLCDALNTISEHFDTVHIFCTRHEHAEEGGTVQINRGTGNWYARYGQIEEWVTIERERSRIRIRDAQKPADD